MVGERRGRGGWGQTGKPGPAGGSCRPARGRGSDKMAKCGAGPIVRRGLRAGAAPGAPPAGWGGRRRRRRSGPARCRPALLGPGPGLPSEGGTKWRNLTWPFGVGDSKINSVCPSLPADRVCQQPGLSLWVPFQNAATAVTNLYKGKGLPPLAAPSPPRRAGLPSAACLPYS